MRGVDSSPAVDGAGCADCEATMGADADDLGIETGIVIRVGGMNGVADGAGAEVLG